VLAIGIEDYVVTRLAACMDCQILLKSEDEIYERARENLLKYHGHTTALQIAIVKQPPKPKSRCELCGG
jgi:hypothetical protein